MTGAVKEGLFYVRRHTCADGSFEWYASSMAIPGGPRANSFGRERRPQRSGRGCR